MSRSGEGHWVYTQIHYLFQMTTVAYIHDTHEARSQSITEVWIVKAQRFVGWYQTHSRMRIIKVFLMR